MGRDPFTTIAVQITCGPPLGRSSRSWALLFPCSSDDPTGIYALATLNTCHREGTHCREHAVDTLLLATAGQKLFDGVHGLVLLRDGLSDDGGQGTRPTRNWPNGDCLTAGGPGSSNSLPP